MSAVRQRLTEARDRHRDVYAEAQLRVPDQVLDLAGEVSRERGTVYGMVRRIDDGLAYEGDSVAAVQERIDVLWHRLREVPSAMPGSSPHHKEPSASLRHESTTAT